MLDTAFSFPGSCTREDRNVHNVGWRPHFVHHANAKLAPNWGRNFLFVSAPRVVLSISHLRRPPNSYYSGKELLFGDRRN